MDRWISGSVPRVADVEQKPSSLGRQTEVGPARHRQRDISKPAAPRRWARIKESIVSVNVNVIGIGNGIGIGSVNGIIGKG